jgi:hypothetical protein
MEAGGAFVFAIDHYRLRTLRIEATADQRRAIA